MKRGYPPLWLCSLLLALALFWKLLGAPVSLAQLGELQTSLWQAKVLAPSRIQRVLMLWQSAQPAPREDEGLEQDSMDADEKELAKYAEPLTLRVWMPETGSITVMPLESYVCGVVAAEMPAAYHIEALRAQAVAARTRACYQMKNGGCGTHTGADICADSACCQGYAGTAACREKWGAEFEAYRDRIIEAVRATKDELLTYEGEIITVLYHAISGGMTESAETVFAQAVPYLVSVESKGEESARGFIKDSYFSFEEAASLLNAAFDSLSCTADQVRRTLTVGEHTSSGRVKTLLIGDRALDARAVRQALELRSTWFSLTMDGEGVTFHQRGYGHGVGMSQAGANGMAADGADYRSILLHYYPGVILEKQ